MMEPSQEEEELFLPRTQRAEPRTTADEATDRSNVIEGPFAPEEGQPRPTGAAALSGDIRTLAPSTDSTSVSSVIEEVIRETAAQVPQGLLPAAPPLTDDPLLASIRNDAYTNVIRVLAGPGGTLSPDGIVRVLKAAHDAAVAIGTRGSMIEAAIAVHVLEEATQRAKLAQLGRQGDVDKRSHRERLALVDAEFALNELKRGLDAKRAQVEAKRGQMEVDLALQQVDRDRKVKVVTTEGQHEVNLTNAESESYVATTVAEAKAKVHGAQARHIYRKATRREWVIDHKEYLVAGAVALVVILGLLIALALK